MALIFCGATVRDGERGDRHFKLQYSGDALIRVRGPVEPGDPVGRSATAGDSWLVRGGDPFVGTALQHVSAPDEVDTASVRLIQVRIGSAAGGANAGLYQLRTVHPDWLACRAVTIDSTGFISTEDEPIYIAKPYDLRQTPWDGQSVDGITYSNFNGDGTQRKATDDGDSSNEQEIIIPPYIDSESEGANRSIIRAIQVAHTGVFVQQELDGPLVELTLEEVSPRYWAETD